MGYSFSANWETQLDSYLTTPPEEPETNLKCEVCGESIYPGDKYFDLDGVRCYGCSLLWLDDQWHYATEEDCFGYDTREDGD